MEGYEQRNLYLFAGNEPVIRKNKIKDYWEIKTGKCHRCGKCCEQVKWGSRSFVKEDGSVGCKFLFDDGSEKLCGIGFPDVGYWRPHGCCIADLGLEGCTVKWEKIESLKIKLGAGSMIFQWRDNDTFKITWEAVL